MPVRPGVLSCWRTGDRLAALDPVVIHIITAKTAPGLLGARLLLVVRSKHTAWSENMSRKWIVCLLFWPFNSVLNGWRSCARAGYLGVPP